jgi:hypothetical protein
MGMRFKRESVDMQRIILIVLCLLGIAGSASAYQLYLSCPDTVQVGLPLKCSVDSNFPAGTTFDVAFYQSGYTATPISRMSVTVQENHATMYQLFDTKGLPGGQYKVEVQFIGTEEEKLSSDSMTWQLPTLLDRSADITITSPMSQTIDEALRIEGSITKLGNEGVEIEVRGRGGVVFGPQWIDTKVDFRSGAGVFASEVPVTRPGEYDVYFKDQEGYIGVKTFNVLTRVSPGATSVPVTALTPLYQSTTVPPVFPTTTQSPLSLFSVMAALSITGLLTVMINKYR